MARCCERRPTTCVGAFLLAAECALLAGFAAWYLWPFSGAIPQPLAVRVEGSPPLADDPWERGIDRFETPAALAAAYPGGKAVVPPELDWRRQSLLRIRWSAEGIIPLDRKPAERSVLYDELASSSRCGGRWLGFYVASPISYGNIGRTFHRVWHQDWFSVPKSSSAAFVEPLVVGTRDGIFWTATAVGVGLTIATWRARSK